MQLILKKSTIPRKIFFNNAVLGRIPPNHPKIPMIEEDSSRIEAGYYGEQRLDFFLGYLPDKNYHMINDLRLSNGKSHYQIDSLIITPTYILDVDSKNMNGELEVDDDSDHLMQTYENRQKSYDNPLLQGQFHLRQFNEFLAQHKIPEIPLEYLVMMSNPNCMIKTKPGSNARYRICKGRRLIFRIEEFSKKFQQVIFSPEIIRKLCKLLLKNHTYPTFDIEKIYQIPKSGLLPGVRCPDCQFLGMIYHHGSWCCPKCNCKSRDAHLKALQDYYLLYGPEITNQQLREFLQLDSVFVASKMLKKLNLAHSSANKNRVYQLPFTLD
jgi:hypothetical protein